MKAKNGISLIVLVITIVVVIILAGAVILSLGDSNPINDARAANLANSQDNIGSAILNVVGNRLAAHATDTSDTYTLLSDNTIDTPVLKLAAYEGTTFADTETTIEKLHEITGWAILNLKEPGNKWFYSVSTGKVYVYLGTTALPTTENDTITETSAPTWSNNTTNAIILKTVTLKVAEPAP